MEARLSVDNPHDKPKSPECAPFVRADVRDSRVLRWQPVVGTESLDGLVGQHVAHYAFGEIRRKGEGRAR